MCMTSLPSPEALQSHYMSVHDTGSSSNDSGNDSATTQAAPVAAGPVSSEVFMDVFYCVYKSGFMVARGYLHM